MSLKILSISALPGASLPSGLWKIRDKLLIFDTCSQHHRGTDWLIRAPNKNMTTPSEVAVTAEGSSGSGSMADHRPSNTFVKVPVKIRQQSIDALEMR